jgi:hypothetical protein
LLDLNFNIIAKIVLNAANGFTGLIDAALIAGQYHIGLLALANFDPPFIIDFEIPVFGLPPVDTGVPAPGALMLLGLGLAGFSAARCRGNLHRPAAR